MKRGQTSKLEDGTKVRAGRFPSGHTYTVRKPPKGKVARGAAETTIKMRGPSGSHTFTRKAKGEEMTEKYKPTRLRKAGALLSNKQKSKNTFKQKPTSTWPNSRERKQTK